MSAEKHSSYSVAIYSSEILFNNTSPCTRILSKLRRTEVALRNPIHRNHIVFFKKSVVRFIFK